MKALSIKQPWAELVAAGLKTMENRTWRTDYRGPLIIHTGQRPDARWNEQEWERMFYGCGDGGRDAVQHLRALLNDGQKLTYGAFIASAEIEDCFSANEAPRSEWHQEGFYGLYLRNVQRFVKPVPFPGQLGIFDIPECIIPRLADEGVKIAHRMNGADPT